MIATPAVYSPYDAPSPLEAELAHLEQRPLKNDWKVLAIMVFIILVCSAVIAPYREVHLPQELLFAAGVSALLLLLPMVLDDHETLILVLLTYLPYNKAVPGTFGGFVRTFNATNILLILILIGWAISSSLRNRPFFRFHRIDKWLGIFLFLALFSLIYGFALIQKDSPVEVVFKLKRWITPMLIYFIVVNNLRTIRHCYLATLTVILTTGMIGFLGLKEFYMDIGVRSSAEKMRISVTSGPNHLGFLFCCYLFFLVALWWVHRKQWIYWMLWAPILACLQSMRLTFSRGAQVGLIAGAFYFLWLTNRKAFVAAVLLGAVVLARPDILPPQITGRLSGTVVRKSGPLLDRLDPSSRGRIEIWQGALAMIRDYPWLGIGYQNFKNRIGDYRPLFRGKDAHNTYLIVATEMGFPALLFFLIVLYMGWRTGLHVYRNSGSDPILRFISLGYLSMFAALVVANFFGSRFDSTEVTVQFWAMTGVIFALARIVDIREGLGRDGPPPEELARESELVHPPAQPRTAS